MKLGIQSTLISAKVVIESLLCLLKNENVDISSIKFKVGSQEHVNQSHDISFEDLINLTLNEIEKAKTVPEQDQQVWATCHLTWKDVAFRALSCKVLNATQNWVHVKNIVCVGSTTANLICKKLGVDPDGTKFDLVESQEAK